MQELKGKITNLEKKKNTEAEGWISVAEDVGRRYVIAIQYLFHREMHLTAKCEHLQNWSRGNNLRICGVHEGCKGKKVKAFVKELIQWVFEATPEVNVQIERAYWFSAAKSINPTATPRSFTDRQACGFSVLIYGLVLDLSLF